MSRPWFAYMVECSDGSLYSGSTNNLPGRVRAHNSGKGAKYTRSRRPVHLVWARAAETRSEAMRAEARLKSLSRGQKERLIPWRGSRPDNEYLRRFRASAPPVPENLDEAGRAYMLALMTDERTLEARGTLCKRYAWSVPTEEAISALAGIGPIVEMGAGLGYWASLLRGAGADVVAYDARPPPDPLNIFCEPVEPWTEVLRGGPATLSRHGDRALFLCWPPLGPTASTCLKAWSGSVLAYVGPEDLTGDAEFHRRLSEEFVREREVGLPSWWTVPDRLTIWRRS